MRMEANKAEAAIAIETTTRKETITAEPIATSLDNENA